MDVLKDSTPRPWQAKRDYANAKDQRDIVSGSLMVAAVSATPQNLRSEADLRLILRAVNSYEPLLEIVKDYLHLLRSDYTGSAGCDYSNGSIRKIEEFLAIAIQEVE